VTGSRLPGSSHQEIRLFLAGQFQRAFI
jgi:hypothetical protein